MRSLQWKCCLKRAHLAFVQLTAFSHIHRTVIRFEFPPLSLSALPQCNPFHCVSTLLFDARVMRCLVNFYYEIGPCCILNVISYLFYTNLHFAYLLFLFSLSPYTKFQRPLFFKGCLYLSLPLLALILSSSPQPGNPLSSALALVTTPMPTSHVKPSPSALSILPLFPTATLMIIERWVRETKAQGGFWMPDPWHEMRSGVWWAIRRGEGGGGGGFDSYAIHWSDLLIPFTGSCDGPSCVRMWACLLFGND